MFVENSSPSLESASQAETSAKAIPDATPIVPEISPTYIPTAEFKQKITIMGKEVGKRLLDYQHGLNEELLTTDPEYVKKLVAAGLEIIFICSNGRSRSSEACFTYSQMFHTPAAFFKGGLRKIDDYSANHLKPQAYSTLIENLSQAPNVFIFCSDAEIMTISFRNLLSTLKQATKARGHQFYRESSSQLDEDTTEFKKKYAQRLKTLT